jgi:hypothetical protein
MFYSCWKGEPVSGPFCKKELLASVDNLVGYTASQFTFLLRANLNVQNIYGQKNVEIKKNLCHCESDFVRRKDLCKKMASFSQLWRRALQ